MLETGLLGRRGLVAAAVDVATRDGRVRLTGVAGIGKSVVLSAVADELAARTDITVLRCASTADDVHVPYLALIDLLTPIADEDFAQLPAPLLQAVDAALLRKAPKGAREALAVRMGVLNLLQLVCARRPILVVLDDLQWIDGPSAEALSFALRRLSATQLRLLAAQRVERPHDAPTDPFPTDTMTQLTVDPLSEEDLTRLLHRVIGDLASPAVATQIHHITAGDPFYALQVAEVLRSRGQPIRSQEPLPIPAELTDLLATRLSGLSPADQDALLVAALAARPTLTILATCGHPPDNLAHAERTGIVKIHIDGSLSFRHPHFRMAAYARSGQHERIAAHARLAQAIAEPVQQARHLALATPHPDEHVAASLDAAAESAKRRGATAIAAELATLAAERTPPHDTPARARRLLDAAANLYAVTLYDDAGRAARQVIAMDVPRPIHARARMIAMQASQTTVGLDEIALGLAEAGDEFAVASTIRYISGYSYMQLGRLDLGLEAMILAADLAVKADDPVAEIRALESAVGLQLSLGDVGFEQTMARMLTVAADPRASNSAWLVHWRNGRLHLYANRFEQAHSELTKALRLAETQAFTQYEKVQIRMWIAALMARWGRGEEAVRISRETQQLEESMLHAPHPMLRALGAFAESVGGTIERALELAAEGIRLAEDVSNQAYVGECYLRLGAAQLLSGDPERAVDALRKGRAIWGGGDPAPNPWHADLADALILTGQLDEATQVIEEGRRAAEPLHRDNVLVSLERSTALLQAARGDLTTAATHLRDLANRQQHLPPPLEHARTLIALADIETRRRRHAAARDALDQARQICETAKAPPWLNLIRRRTDQRTTATNPDQLAPHEKRIASLVADGATNKEIATKLAISIKTAEAMISRIYRKLGVRTRVELARHPTTQQKPTQQEPTEPIQPTTSP